MKNPLLENMELKRELPKYRLQDSELPNDPALHYKFWTHEQVMHWLRGLNEDLYAKHEEQFESSQLDGRTFEAMSNLHYLKEEFSMENEAALALADVVLQRIRVFYLNSFQSPRIPS